MADHAGEEEPGETVRGMEVADPEKSRKERSTVFINMNNEKVKILA